MTKYLLILFFFTCTLVPVAQAQQVPQGMKYQAVARGLSGEVLAEKPVTLRINLNSKRDGATKVHYSETHSVRTNALGLFDLTIGAGKATLGKFTDVPWSTEDIWMELAIQDGAKSGFSTVSSSRLLAVPYAFHAMTANELATKGAAKGGAPTNGVPSNVWSTFGNTGTNPSTDRVGTMDYVDLIFVTNKTERLRISKDGDIDIKNSLTVGKDVEVGNDLTVKQDVFLNTTGGATINNGPLTVANGKPTVLTGILNVNGNTDLDGTLNTDGAATLRSTLNVNGDTDLDGTLNTDGATTLRSTLNVNGDTDLDGTLNTDGAATLRSTLNVNGNTDLDGTLNTDGAATMRTTLNVNGATDLDGTLNVDGAAALKSTLGVDGAARLNNTLNVTGQTTLNNKLAANGQVTINADVNGADSNYDAYPLRVQGSNQGIAVKVDGSRNNGNNFVTFMDANGIQGRIEGQTRDELEDSQEYKTQLALFTLQGVALAADIIGLGAEAAGLYAGTITAPLGVAVTAQATAATVEAASFITELVTWQDDVRANAGVAYESGNGDYAEWLERAKSEPDMMYGQVVGVKGGKLSLSTDRADHFMVVSHRPIVLGNMQAPEREKNFEKVAFMGQVPVRVVGKVAIGDYIIPSGNHDGLGIAVSPANMKLGDYARIVGVAWQSAPDAALNMVNVAVGINSNDLTAKMVAMNQQLEALNQKTDNMMAFLQGKAPLHNGPAAAPAAKMADAALAQTTLVKTMSDADFDRAIDRSAPTLVQIFAEAKRQMQAKGINVDGNKHLVEFFRDPVASVKQLRRDPSMSTQWGRFDQQLQQKNKK